MEEYRETPVLSEKNRYVSGKQWMKVVVCVLLATISFFVAARWATSVETYSSMIKTLDGLQKKALGLSGTATALATGAAAIPGDATTPIANKLADVAGYMVIVYAVIIVEKYLLTLTGFVAFKILFPIGCVLLAAGSFFRDGWKEFAYRIAIKGIVLGILLWGLVPTSIWVTDKVNETYEKSYETDFNVEDTEQMLEEDAAADTTTTSDNTETENEKFSIGGVLNRLKDKVGDAVDAVSDAATEKIDALEAGLNKILEGVAVMIVTTCAIPILVMIAFGWILRSVAGLQIPAFSVKRMPKASNIRKKISSEK